ncbi:hypothetical protein BDY19DRAFT_18071 [Irpex rosettiformis]|uniref:Uncharacterized protein n=1 Tax=Irpex rosettiformis TaxID=378272 RepID=A0ACB8UJA0_9APHY|nr:hypothetical protein BDY19DRAFT_18071 [Irpex rosettiformis]
MSSTSTSGQARNYEHSHVVRKVAVPIPRRSIRIRQGEDVLKPPPISDSSIKMEVSDTPLSSMQVKVVKKPRLEDFCGPDTPPTGKPASIAKRFHPYTSQPRIAKDPRVKESLPSGTDFDQSTPQPPGYDEGSRLSAIPSITVQVPSKDPRIRPSSTRLSTPAPMRYDSEAGSSGSVPRLQQDIDTGDRSGSTQADLSSEVDTSCAPYDYDATEYHAQNLLDSPASSHNDATAGMRELGHRIKSTRSRSKVTSRSKEPHKTSIKHFLDKCGLEGQHLDIYAKHFKNMGIPTCQDLDALIKYKLDSQLIDLLKNDCGGRWLQINLIKNGLEKHRRALARMTSASPQTS